MTDTDCPRNPALHYYICNTAFFIHHTPFRTQNIHTPASVTCTGVVAKVKQVQMVKKKQISAAVQHIKKNIYKYIFPSPFLFWTYSTHDQDRHTVGSKSDSEHRRTAFCLSLPLDMTHAHTQDVPWQMHRFFAMACTQQPFYLTWHSTVDNDRVRS